MFKYRANEPFKILESYEGNYNNTIELEDKTILIEEDNVFSQDEIFDLKINKDFIGTIRANHHFLAARKQEHINIAIERAKSLEFDPLYHSFINYAYFFEYKIKEFFVDGDSLFYSVENKNLASKNKGILISYHYSNDIKVELNSCYKFLHKGAFYNLEQAIYIDLKNVEVLDDDFKSPFNDDFKNRTCIIKGSHIKHIETPGRGYVEEYSKLHNAILVFNNIEKGLDAFYYVRMLHGFMLYKDDFDKDDVELYKGLLNRYKFEFLSYLSTRKQDKKTKEIIDEVITVINSMGKKKLTLRQSSDYLLYLILYQSIDKVKIFLEKYQEFEYSPRILSLALRYRDSSFTKLLLTYGFKLEKARDVECNNPKIANKEGNFSDTIVKFYGLKGKYNITSHNILSLVFDNLDTSYVGSQRRNVFYDANKNECSLLIKAPIEERVRSLSYLYEKGFESEDDFVTLYYYALCMNEEKIAHYLYKKGIRFKDTSYALILNGEIKTIARDLFLENIFVKHKSYKLVAKYAAYEDLSVSLTKKDCSYLINFLKDKNFLDSIFNNLKLTAQFKDELVMLLVRFKDIEILDYIFTKLNLTNSKKYVNYALKEGDNKDIVAYLMNKTKNDTKKNTLKL